VIKLKKKEFLSLKQGSMTVSEYRDKFLQLSWYAPEEVAQDEKKQELFLEGLHGGLQYQLVAHTFLSFQYMIDKVLVLESKRRELGEQKRKFNGSGQSSSNTRPRLPMPQGPQQQRTGMQQGQYQNQFQRTNQSQNQYQRSNQMVQRPTPPEPSEHTFWPSDED